MDRIGEGSEFPPFPTLPSLKSFPVTKRRVFSTIYCVMGLFDANEGKDGEKVMKKRREKKVGQKSELEIEEE